MTPFETTPTTLQTLNRQFRQGATGAELRQQQNQHSPLIPNPSP
ncbi:MAG: hypothetical protein AAGG51_14500 [Cyanobacteria bacterium P01_G01_bin.54]